MRTAAVKLVRNLISMHVCLAHNIYSLGVPGKMRELFFRDAMKRLQDSAKVGSKEFRKQAAEKETGINRYYPYLPIAKEVLHYPAHMVHEYSWSIWPNDALSEFIPLLSCGDGNCLYCSVSRLCTGSEEHHIELRARTVCEIALHPQFYLEDKCSILKFTEKPIQNVLASTSRNYLLQPGTSSTAVSRTCFELDTMESCIPATYANMWEMYGVASVLGIPIISGLVSSDVACLRELYFIVNEIYCTWDGWTSGCNSGRPKMSVNLDAVSCTVPFIVYVGQCVRVAVGSWYPTPGSGCGLRVG